MRTFLKGILSLAFGLFLLELGCRLSFSFQARQWENVKNSPDHYYRKSSDGKLVYELARPFSFVKEGRRLRINAQGIRDDADRLPSGRLRVGLVGDSVVFGVGLSQEQTIASLLQARLESARRRRVKALNLGVPGYGLPELKESLEGMHRKLHLDRAIYLMNPNDFALRNTLYEGADNGLYRMYEAPRIKSLWMAKKAIYRWHKGNRLTSVEWYQWLYNGTQKRALPILREMANYCAQNRIAFSVVLLMRVMVL